MDSCYMFGNIGFCFIFNIFDIWKWLTFKGGSSVLGDLDVMYCLVLEDYNALEQM